MRPVAFSRKALALTCGLCLAASGTASAQVISNMGSWNGSEWWRYWDIDLNANSWGQTFTAPNVRLPTFTFVAQRDSGSGNFDYSASIFAFSGNRISGSALATAPLGSTANIGNTPGEVTLSFSGAALTPGQRYAVVVSRLGQDSTGLASFRLGFIPSIDTEESIGSLRHPEGDLEQMQFVSDFYAFAHTLAFGPSGPDAANTWLGLQANAYAVRSVLTQRAAMASFALDNDCSVFDTYGLCVSVGFRTSQIGSEYNDNGETAGILSFAYRVTPEFRLGGFIDQSLTSNTPVGVDAKNTQPMLGAFAVYQENANFSGLTVRAAMAYQQGDLRITRPELENTEAGTGRARTTAMAFGAELAYGFPIDSSWVAQPYGGIRRTDSERRGYTETTSEAVEFPITYSRYGQVVTSATAGLRLRGAITPQFSLTFGAGVEYDLDSKMDRYAGTSAIPDLESFSIATNQQQNELRGVGTAGMRYMIAANQALAVDTSIRQLPYGNDPAISTMLRYSIGF